MRIAFPSFLALVTLATPAAANGCYWSGGRIFCNAMCRVTDRWWDGSREWMRYSCAPPDEVLIAAGVAILFVVAIIAAIASAASTDAHTKDVEQIAADNAKSQELTRKYEALVQETEAHIASMLDKYRGNRHG